MYTVNRKGTRYNFEKCFLIYVMSLRISHSIFNNLVPFLQGGEGLIEYSIDPVSDPGRLFLVDETGSVRLAGELDRETASAHTLLILAMDDGTPRRTATATLMVST